MRLLLSIIVALLAVQGIAANSVVDSLKAKHPNSDGVYIENNTSILLSVHKKKGLIITSNFYEHRMFLNDQARLYSKESVRYGYHLDIDNVVAYSVVPGEKKPQRFNVTEFDTTDEYSSSIFYNDGKNLEFHFNGLQKGASSYLSYSELEKEEHFFGSCYMGSYLPIEKGVLRVEFPKHLKLNYQEVNFEGYNITFEKTENKKNYVYQWIFKDIPKYKYVNRAVALPYVFPVVLFQIAEYQLGDSTVKVIPDLDGLYKWYYTSIKNSKEAKDDSLRTFVEEIIKDDSTELDKVRSVFNWVQNNIEYVAIEYGSGGIIPREAGLVYQRRYGDCKDMSCLIHKMLNSVDIESNMTWVGTRRLPYKYSEIPSPLIDNHMICSYETDDSTYFLDATDKFVPFGAPTAMIQTKEALVEKGPSNYKIKKIPSMPASFSGKKDSCILRLEDKEIKGKCICEFKGYTAGSIRHYLDSKQGEDREKYIRNLVRKGNNKFYLDKYELTNEMAKDKPLLVKYEFTLKDYAQQVDNEVYLNLNISKYLKSGKFDKEQFIYDFNGEYAFYEIEINTLKLDDGMTVDYLPPNGMQSKNDYSYSIQYSSSLGEVSVRNEVKIDYLLFPTTRFDEWNKVVKSINKDYSESLLLKRKTQ